MDKPDIDQGYPLPLDFMAYPQPDYPLPLDFMAYPQPDYPLPLDFMTYPQPDYDLHMATYLASSTQDDFEKGQRARRSRNVTEPEIIPLEASTTSSQISTFTVARSERIIFSVLMRQLATRYYSLDRLWEASLGAKIELQRKVYIRDRKIQSLLDLQETESERYDLDDTARLELQVTVEEMRTEIADLTEEKQTMSDSHDQLSKSETKLTQDKKKLKGKNRKLSDKNGELVETNNKLSSDNQQLTDDNRQMITAKGELSTANDKLSDDNRQLAATNSDLSNSNAKLSDDNREISIANKKLSDDNSQLRKRVDELGSAVQKLSDDKSQQLKRIDELCSAGRKICDENSQLLKANGEIVLAKEEASASYAEVYGGFCQVKKAHDEWKEYGENLYKYAQTVEDDNNKWSEYSKRLTASIQDTELSIGMYLQAFAPAMMLFPPPEIIGDLQYIAAGIHALGTALSDAQTPAQPTDLSSFEVAVNGENGHEVSPSITISPPTTRGISGKELMKIDGTTGNGRGERATFDTTLLTPPPLSSKTKKGKEAVRSSNLAAKGSHAGRTHNPGTVPPVPSQQLAPSFDLYSFILQWAVRYHLNGKSKLDRVRRGQTIRSSSRFTSRLDTLISFLAVQDQNAHSIIRQIAPFPIGRLTLPRAPSLSAGVSNSQAENGMDPMGVDEAEGPPMNVDEAKGRLMNIDEGEETLMNVDEMEELFAQFDSEDQSHVDSTNTDNAGESAKQAAPETSSHTDVMHVDDTEQPAVQDAPQDGSEMDVKDDEGPAAQTACETSANADSNDMDTREDKGPAEEQTPEASTNVGPGVAVPNFPVFPAFDTNHTFGFNPSTPNSQTGPSFNTNQPTTNFASTRAAKKARASTPAPTPSFFSTYVPPSRENLPAFQGFQPSPNFNLADFGQKLPDFSFATAHIPKVTDSAPIGTAEVSLNFAADTTATGKFNFGEPSSSSEPQSMAQVPAKPKSRAEFIKQEIENHEGIRNGVIILDVEVRLEQLSIDMMDLRRTQIRMVVDKA